jgi:hypothetical protein
MGHRSMFVGLDVHKDSIDVAISTADGNRTVFVARDGAEGGVSSILSATGQHARALEETARCGTVVPVSSNS